MELPQPLAHGLAPMPATGIDRPLRPGRVVSAFNAHIRGHSIPHRPRIPGDNIHGPFFQRLGDVRRDVSGQYGFRARVNGRGNGRYARPGAGTGGEIDDRKRHVPAFDDQHVPGASQPLFNRSIQVRDGTRDSYFHDTPQVFRIREIVPTFRHRGKRQAAPRPPGFHPIWMYHIAFSCQSAIFSVLNDMPYRIVFSEESNYLLCITDGTVEDAEEYIAWGLESLKKTIDTGHKKILYDNRTFKLNLVPLDIVLFAKQYEEMDVAQLGLRMAVVSNPKNPEVSRLVETTLTNRSAAYKTFGSQAEALTWLLKE